MSEANSRGPSNTPAQRTDRTGTIKVLFDWFGFTFLDEEFSIDAALRFFYQKLGIPFEAWQPGRQNYEGYAHSVQYENINIYWEGASNQGIHVDITGQGCRYVELMFQKLRVQHEKLRVHNEKLRVHEDDQGEPYFWYHFLVDLVKLGAKFTRVDVAIDDFGKHFSVPYIFQKLLLGEVTSKFKSWSPDGYFGFDGAAKQGMTLYFGSDTSRIQVCMYEKAKQLGLENLDWTRTEIRFKHQRAIEFIQRLLAEKIMDKQYDMGVIAAGILKDYITFRDRTNDSNKRRWPISPFWDEFLKGVEPIRLTTALPDRSIMRTRSWFKKGVSKAFVMMYMAYQGINDQWLLEDYQEGVKKLKQKDLDIIMEFRRMFEDDMREAIDGAITVVPNKEAADGNSDLSVKTN